MDGSGLSSAYASAGRTFILTRKGSLRASATDDQWSSSWGVFEEKIDFDTPPACSVVVGCLSASAVVIAPEVCDAV